MCCQGYPMSVSLSSHWILVMLEKSLWNIDVNEPTDLVCMYSIWVSPPCHLRGSINTPTWAWTPRGTPPPRTLLWWLEMMSWNRRHRISRCWFTDDLPHSAFSGGQAYDAAMQLNPFTVLHLHLRHCKLVGNYLRPCLARASDVLQSEVIGLK